MYARNVLLHVATVLKLTLPNVKAVLQDYFCLIMSVLLAKTIAMNANLSSCARNVMTVMH